MTSTIAFNALSPRPQKPHTQPKFSGLIIRTQPNTTEDQNFVGMNMTTMLCPSKQPKKETSFGRIAPNEIIYQGGQSEGISPFSISIGTSQRVAHATKVFDILQYMPKPIQNAVVPKLMAYLLPVLNPTMPKEMNWNHAADVNSGDPFHPDFPNSIVIYKNKFKAIQDTLFVSLHYLINELKGANTFFKIEFDPAEGQNVLKYKDNLRMRKTRINKILNTSSEPAPLD